MEKIQIGATIPIARPETDCPVKGLEEQSNLWSCGGRSARPGPWPDGIAAWLTEESCERARRLCVETKPPFTVTFSQAMSEVRSKGLKRLILVDGDYNKVQEYPA